MLTSCLAAVEGHVIKYYERVCGRSGGVYFGLMGFQVPFWIGLGLGVRCSQFVCLCFFCFCTALPRGLIEDILDGLVEGALGGEGCPCLACGGGGAFFASEKPRECRAWSCRVFEMR